MATRSVYGFSEAAGFRVFFRPDTSNVCPCCHKANWLVGRMTAECAFCATALPIESGARTGAGLFRKRGAIADDWISEAA